MSVVKLSYLIKAVSLSIVCKLNFFQLTGAEHRVTSAYHPQSNGLTERFNQTLKTTLMKLINDEQNDWDEHLPVILFSYRTSIKKQQQQTTKLTPLEVMYCWYVSYCLT